MAIQLSKIKYAKNIPETIGDTPLVRLNSVTEGIEATILAKVEYFNPGGRVKDRIGIHMINDAERKGDPVDEGSQHHTDTGQAG